MTFQEYIQDLPVEEQQIIVTEIMGLSNLFAERMDKIKASLSTAHMISLGFYEGVTGKLEELANQEDANTKEQASRFVSDFLIEGPNGRPHQRNP